MRTGRVLRGLSISVLSTVGATAFQEPPSPRLVEPSDYGRFERLERSALSNDGQWIAVPISRVDGTRRLELYSLGAESEPIVIDQAQGAEFSDDSNWLAYSVVPTERDAEALVKKDEPIRHRAELRRLGEDDPIELGEVEHFSFGGAGRYLATRGYAPEAPEGKDGKEDAEDLRPRFELAVRTLDTGASAPFGHVVESAWENDGAGSLIALIVETPGGADAVQLYDPSEGMLRVLDSGDEPYTGLSWRNDALDLAVLRAESRDGLEGSDHTLLAWRDVGGTSEAYAFRASETSGFPDATRLVEHRQPAWSDDGARLFFGIGAWTAKAPESEEEEKTDEVEPADVEVWHSFDERIIAMQRVRKEDDRKAHRLAAWNLASDDLVEIGVDVHEHEEILEGGRHVLTTDRSEYRFDNMFDQPRHDLVLVDAATGDRRTVARAVQYGVSGSATGRYVLYFKGGDYHAYDTATSSTANLTADIGTSFVNDEYDTPVRHENPPWGNAGWTSGDELVLLYDRYDIWAVSPSGNSIKVTSGAEDAVRHRVIDLDDEEIGFDIEQPIYVSAYGEWTKRSGFARIGHLAAGPVERVVFGDQRFRSLAKAKDADLYSYVIESVDDSPDVFVSDGSLVARRQVTHTNPFQTEFSWTRGELVDYESAWGKKLQGALYYPANYEPGNHYPMIVYVYERLSQNLHRYVVPDERRYYNPAVWTQQGYFVFNPDIAYQDRDPGPSAVDCVVPAVEAVLKKGLVDRDKIGLVGHSWGGYEASFIPTQTNVFRTSVAGAPLTNFFSMFGTIHWRQGYPETSHFETGQARMEVPYWEDTEAYFRNSPVTFIPALEAPMLVFFGDDDGTVDFHQGIELYNYARRAGKHVVMLVYRGEDHGARKRKTQVDYHRRILHWFGHFLKDEPADDWVTKGQTLLEREREIEAR